MTKTLTGTVASNKGNKTIVVSIVSHKTHPVYKKKYLVTKRVMAHDETNNAEIGDKVLIAETRPISARKHFTLEKVIERAAIEHVEEETQPIVPADDSAENKVPGAKRSKAAKSGGDE